MKAFNKTKAKKHIKMKQNKNTYIKTVSIVLACVILLVGIVLFTFAKFENNQEYTLINGQFGQYHMENCSYSAGKTWTYSYTGSSQTFSVPCLGTYRIELWGAGMERYGNSNNYGGPSNGSYVAGTIDLDKTEKLYVFVGEKSQKTRTASTFNGGGSATMGTYYNQYLSQGSYYSMTYAGAGATDIRYFGSTTPTSTQLNWTNTTGLNSRIMVAAGASRGSSGGGLYSEEFGTTYKVTGATQTSGGAATRNTSKEAIAAGRFGVGSNGETAEYGYGSSGGGGGYYGGSGCYASDWSGIINSSNGYGSSTAGSSYISGHTGCVAIAGGSSSNPRAVKKSGCTTGTTDNECSVHYSNKVFTDTVMIDGYGYNWTNERGSEVLGIPSYDGLSTMETNGGNGYAKITLISPVGLVKD